MYIFAEPVTEERADEIQNKNQEAHRAFERDIVGIVKDDPALQAEWHEIQDQINDELQSDSEEAAKLDATAESVQSTEETAEADASSQEGVENPDEPEAPTGPLMGWTLAVRHRLNGHYVERPEDITPEDSWTIEYHVRELDEKDRWSVYEKVKRKRNELIGEERDKAGAKARTDKYRDLIKRISEKGRKWRTEQDALAAEAETKVFEPLGPGSQTQTQTQTQT